jgi:hypothetical protein
MRVIGMGFGQEAKRGLALHLFENFRECAQNRQLNRDAQSHTPQTKSAASGSPVGANRSEPKSELDRFLARPPSVETVPEWRMIVRPIIPSTSRDVVIRDQDADATPLLQQERKPQAHEWSASWPASGLPWSPSNHLANSPTIE